MAARPLELGEWLSYNPIRGDKMPPALRTEVRITYDDRNLYFAFHCFDNEPDKIRTNVARRDSAFNDDWVAISLDSASTGQTAYHLFSNPSGSQMDAVEYVRVGRAIRRRLGVGQRRPDHAAMATSWRCGAAAVAALFERRRRQDGHAVLSTRQPDRHVLLVAGHAARAMGVRSARASACSTGFQPRGWWRCCRASPTRSTRRARRPIAGIGVDDNAELGLSGKFGITSNVTLDGTINPDFSQVESDAFQVEVNQRFPVFFSEKRPFFMEGMGLFNLAGTGGDGNMRTAVHTRTIVDPMWGSKMTGTAGKTTFGVLNALDETPLDVGDRGDIDRRQQQAFHDRARDLRAERCRTTSARSPPTPSTRGATTGWLAADVLLQAVDRRS